MTLNKEQKLDELNQEKQALEEEINKVKKAKKGTMFGDPAIRIE
jgi:cell division protein FtsB